MNQRIMRLILEKIKMSSTSSDRVQNIVVVVTSISTIYMMETKLDRGGDA